MHSLRLSSSRLPDRRGLRCHILGRMWLGVLTWSDAVSRQYPPAVQLCHNQYYLPRTYDRAGQGIQAEIN